MKWLSNFWGRKKKQKILSSSNKYIINITANNERVLSDVLASKDDIEKITSGMLEENYSNTADIANEILSRLQIKYLVQVIRRGRNIEINFVGNIDNIPYNVVVVADNPEIKKVVILKEEAIKKIVLESIKEKNELNDLACKIIFELDLQYTVIIANDPKLKCIKIKFI